MLIARRRTSLLTRFHESLPEYVRYTWLVCAIGAALLAALVPSLEIETLAFAVPTALGVGGIYTSLLYIFGQDYDQLDGGERAGIRRVVFSIASRAIGLLAIVGIVLEGVWPGSTLAVTNAALAGSLKAAHWIAIFYVVRRSRNPVAFSHLLTLIGARDALGNRADNLGLCCYVTRLFHPSYRRPTRHRPFILPHGCRSLDSGPNSGLHSENRKGSPIIRRLRLVASSIAHTAHASE